MERFTQAIARNDPELRISAASDALDPVSRASEVLFGLIMVLSFTLSLDTAGAGRSDVRAVLLGVVGCNLAWAIIDAAMYLMAVRGDRRMAISAIHAIRDAESSEAGRAVVAANLPPVVLPAMSAADLERIRLYLRDLPPESVKVGLGQGDYRAAIVVFLLVFLCLFPVIVPFLLFDDIRLALRVSNVVAICMLFLTGFMFGREVGRPYRTGFLMVAIGISFVAIALVFGG